MKKNRAVFLDRDGTINKNEDVLDLRKHLRLLPRSAAAIKALNKLGFLVIVVTNQAVVARGLLKRKEIHEIHKLFLERLSKRGATIHSVYYCPHHPEAVIGRYRVACECRKPNIGMIMQATKRFHIDLGKSFMIGDATGDVLAGKRAGLTTILVKTGLGGKDGRFKAKPDYVAEDLEDAVTIIEASSK